MPVAEMPIASAASEPMIVLFNEALICIPSFQAARRNGVAEVYTSKLQSNATFVDIEAQQGYWSQNRSGGEIFIKIRAPPSVRDQHPCYSIIFAFRDRTANLVPQAIFGHKFYGDKLLLRRLAGKLILNRCRPILTGGRCKPSTPLRCRLPRQASSRAAYPGIHADRNLHRRRRLPGQGRDLPGR